MIDDEDEEKEDDKEEEERDDGDVCDGERGKWWEWGRERHIRIENDVAGHEC